MLPFQRLGAKTCPGDSHVRYLSLQADNKQHCYPAALLVLSTTVGSQPALGHMQREDIFRYR